MNNSFTVESYGNVIGIADSDFEIRGAKVEHSEKDLRNKLLTQEQTNMFIRFIESMGAYEL